ncbi:hypothetical protein [Shewanella sp. S1-58-MNA-CIBAN-0166]|uniref:hypothetical protein n=1 Tax=Shewanella sp. S1-58-MNA-CIBAN-0166 TaxID=3140467 RepID=UPI00331F7ADA
MSNPEDFWLGLASRVTVNPYNKGLFDALLPIVKLPKEDNKPLSKDVVIVVSIGKVLLFKSDTNR